MLGLCVMPKIRPKLLYMIEGSSTRWPINNAHHGVLFFHGCAKAGESALIEKLFLYSAIRIFRYSVIQMFYTNKHNLFPYN